MIGSNSIMLDLETLGTGPTSVILSIGAVRFTADEVVDTYHEYICPQSCLDVGMNVDGGTILWWMRQSPEALAAQDKERVLLSQAIWSFTVWLGDDVTEIWGNGSDLDNVILTSAYRFCSRALPWSYKANRCYRTVKNIYPAVEIERIGTHHDALDDARSQALHLMRIARSIVRD